MPGLIPGASEGKGLGLEFLRHVERCSVLVHVLDCATLEPGRDPSPTSTSSRPSWRRTAGWRTGRALVVLNKIDVPEARELAEHGAPDLEARGLQVFVVSAATHEGLRELAFAMADAWSRGPRRGARRRRPTRIVLRPTAVDDAGFTVDAARASASACAATKPERWVRQTDFGNDEAVGYLADRLARLGVEEALLEAGAEAGAEVVIGERGRRRSSSTGSRTLSSRRRAAARPPRHATCRGWRRWAR